MKILKFIAFLVVLLAIIYFLTVHNYNKIAKESKAYIYSSISDTPAKRAALVLGCAKYLSNNQINYYYKYRIEAAVELWRAGKIKAIVVSGDNGSKNYDEPTLMKEDLIKAGVPEKFITIDYAGFRTLDSIVRAKYIFDLNDYIIVSQKFHLERAIFIAHQKGQKVIGFTAKEFNNSTWTKKMIRREMLARVKAWLDVNIFSVEPKFYGKKVVVNYR